MTNFVIPIMAYVIFSLCVEDCLMLPVFSNFIPVSKEGYVEQHLGPIIVQYGKLSKMTHAAFVRNAAMSSVTTVSAMSSSVVWSIIVISQFTLSNIAFTCGFLTLVGLCLIPYDSQRASK